MYKDGRSEEKNEGGERHVVVVAAAAAIRFKVFFSYELCLPGQVFSPFSHLTVIWLLALLFLPT